MKKILIAALVIAIPLLLLFYFAWGGLFHAFVEKDYELRPSAPGAFSTLIKQLEDDGIVVNGKVFRALAVMTRSDKKLQSGYYHFSTRMPIWEILRKLKKGDFVRVEVLIKEGDDLYDTALEMEKTGAVSNRSVFVDYMHSKSALTRVTNFLERKGIHLKGLVSAEGFIYPDTYRVKKGEGREEILNLGLENFDKKIISFWEDKKKMAASSDFYYFLKASSLIEKETAVPSERPLVSSVLVNRLRIGDKLRFDPTIIYALKREGQYEENLHNGVIKILNKHFYLDSKWNTYFYKGLPPTPICCPSTSSFEAALFPARSDYFFFVARGGGSREHAFSKTYEEHLANIRKYQLRQ